MPLLGTSTTLEQIHSCLSCFQVWIVVTLLSWEGWPLAGQVSALSRDVKFSCLCVICHSGQEALTRERKACVLHWMGIISCPIIGQLFLESDVCLFIQCIEQLKWAKLCSRLCRGHFKYTWWAPRASGGIGDLGCRALCLAVCCLYHPPLLYSSSLSSILSSWASYHFPERPSLST